MAGLRVGRRYFRGHGLGNDYLVFQRAEEGGWPLRPETVRAVCDRWRGVGGDGIVVLLERRPRDRIFPLRMFNPDGSEFERSGNGLRVLAAHLFREGLVGGESFRVRSGGARITMTVHEHSAEGLYDVSVEMGRARIGGEAVGLDPAHLDAEGRAVHPERGPVAFHPVSVGNPHAVVFTEDLSEEALHALGPFLSGHPAFQNGTNVQLVNVREEGVRIAIWERGVGRTSASGTSSCAAAAAAVAGGKLAPGPVAVDMEGGRLHVTVDPELEIVLRGPVQEVSEGRLASGFQAWLSGI
jgi:diaminopimelate epimerase